MSHIRTSNLELNRRDLLLRATEQLHVEVLGEGAYKLFSGERVRGLGLQLPGWKYPTVVDEKGVARYDNYDGKWGDPIELDRLCQRYAIEAAIEAATHGGMNYNENILENGDIELELVKIASH